MWCSCTKSHLLNHQDTCASLADWKCSKDTCLLLIYITIQHVLTCRDYCIRFKTPLPKQLLVGMGNHLIGFNPTSWINGLDTHTSKKGQRTSRETSKTFQRKKKYSWINIRFFTRCAHWLGEPWVSHLQGQVALDVRHLRHTKQHVKHGALACSRRAQNSTQCSHSNARWHSMQNLDGSCCCCGAECEILQTPPMINQVRFLVHSSNKNRVLIECCGYKVLRRGSLKIIWGTRPWLSQGGLNILQQRTRTCLLR